MKKLTFDQAHSELTKAVAAELKRTDSLILYFELKAFLENQEIRRLFKNRINEIDQTVYV